MTTSRAFWDAIARAKRNLTLVPDDNELDCRECGGSGTDGDDGPPCQYCDGAR